MINCLQEALSANLDHQSFYFISLHYAYGNRGGFRGGVRPPPLKFAKHMLYNVN